MDIFRRGRNDKNKKRPYGEFKDEEEEDTGSPTASSPALTLEQQAEIIKKKIEEGREVSRQEELTRPIENWPEIKETDSQLLSKLTWRPSQLDYIMRKMRREGKGGAKKRNNKKKSQSKKVRKQRSRKARKGGSSKKTNKRAVKRSTRRRK